MLSFRSVRLWIPLHAASTLCKLQGLLSVFRNMIWCLMHVWVCNQCICFHSWNQSLICPGKPLCTRWETIIHRFMMPFALIMHDISETIFVLTDISAFKVLNPLKIYMYIYLFCYFNLSFLTMNSFSKQPV